MRDNLEYFNEEFQFQAIRALIEEKGLFNKLYKIIDQNAFKDSGSRDVVGVLKDYYKKNGRTPDYTSLKIYLKNRALNADVYAEYMTILARIQVASLIGIDTIEDELIKFFKLKALTKFANYIIDSINSNKSDDEIIKKTSKQFENIMMIGADDSEITIINEDTIKRAITSGDNDSIPTGIKELDEKLYGGLGRTEIGLFVAPTGYGKTTAGTIFAQNAARLGYKALQIYFEDKPEDIVRKHIAMTNKVNSNVLRKLTNEKADSIIKETDYLSLSDNLILCRMADGITTVEDINNKIRELMNTRNFKPDLIVIDYFSSLKHSANPSKNSLEAEANCMRKIKEMIATKYDAAVWVLQQTNRTAVLKDGDSSGMANWQGSYQATQPASVWLTLQRTKEQKQNFRADIIFNKTRHSQPKEDLLDIVFDNAKLQIDCSDTKLISFSGNVESIDLPF